MQLLAKSAGLDHAEGPSIVCLSERKPMTAAAAV
jgi:hypothetical protein